MSEVDDAMKAVEDCTAGFDEAEVLSFEVTWLRKQEAALRARVAELERRGTHIGYESVFSSPAYPAAPSVPSGEETP